MEHGELRDRACLVEAGQRADAGAGRAVPVQPFVAPELGALVRPRGGTVGVVPVREKDRRHPDRSAHSGLQGIAHLLRGARGIAGVDDDPAFGCADRHGMRDAPAREQPDIRRDLDGALLGHRKTFVRLDHVAGGDGTVRSRHGLLDKRRAAPERSRGRRLLRAGRSGGQECSGAEREQGPGGGHGGQKVTAGRHGSMSLAPLLGEWGEWRPAVPSATRSRWVRCSAASARKRP